MVVITRLEAAKRLGVSDQTVSRLIRAGKLRGRKVTPRRVVVEEASVEEYLAALALIQGTANKEDKTDE
jgi:excisionase family DNA binding protein